MWVPATTDLLQGKEKLTVPEIRVWCKPHLKPGFKESDSGDAYYHVFITFRSALTFIANHPEAEPVPLVAFRGYELNLWDMVPQLEVKP